MKPAGQAPSLTVEGRVATLTLRRPEVANRLDDNDLGTLYKHLEAIDAQPDILVVRLMAEGRYFCSGYNVDSFAEGHSGPRVTFEELADRLEQLRPITIAAINGGLYGGATDLALACDFRIGVAAANLFVPAARLGLHFYRGGMERMVSRLGMNVAKRVLLTCEKMDAEAMLAAGFLTEQVADGAALQQATDTLTQTLASMAPLALLGMKRHLNALGHGGIDGDAFLRDMERAGNSEDLVEGAKAWREKRTPVFQGR